MWSGSPKGTSPARSVFVYSPGDHGYRCPSIPASVRRHPAAQPGRSTPRGGTRTTRTRSRSSRPAGARPRPSSSSARRSRTNPGHAWRAHTTPPARWTTSRTTTWLGPTWSAAPRTRHPVPGREPFPERGRQRPARRPPGGAGHRHRTGTHGHATAGRHDRSRRPGQPSPGCRREHSKRPTGPGGSGPGPWAGPATPGLQTEPGPRSASGSTSALTTRTPGASGAPRPRTSSPWPTRPPSPPRSRVTPASSGAACWTPSSRRRPRCGWPPPRPRRRPARWHRLRAWSGSRARRRWSPRRSSPSPPTCTSRVTTELCSPDWSPSP
jgi:hypothetical protein